MEQNLSPEQMLELERQLAVLSRGVAEVIPEKGLREKLVKSLATGKPLKVKLGLDPSAPDVHLGHTVVLRKLRQFLDFGHEVQLVIGDFTGRIGDPTGRSTTRKQLNDDDIEANARTYIEQFGKVMDMDKARVVFNSHWLAKLDFAAVVHLASHITVARMLEREDFSKRYKEGEPIYIHEFFYPLMQAYDSIALSTDIELGGTEQKFNLLMGRHLQEVYGQEKQIVMTCPLLVGLDGERKMSKSLGNYIGITENADAIYGKVMSIADEKMVEYFELVTDIAEDELHAIRTGLATGTIHPRDAKMDLAKRLVTMYHSGLAAVEVERRFVLVFREGAIPEDIPNTLWLGSGTVEVVELMIGLGLTLSKSEARRLIRGGAVRINGSRVENDALTVEIRDEMIVQVGKRKFARIKV